MSDIENILSNTDGGYSIFARYLGEVSTKCKFRNPFRDDTVASCRLYYHHYPSGSRYYLQDYGDSTWCGDCFHFVARLHNLDDRIDFTKVLRIIHSDMNVPVRIHPSRSEVKTVSWNSFEADYHPFDKCELRYWAKYGIDQATLERYDVKAVSSCTINKGGKVIPVKPGPNSLLFGYLVGTSIKLYRPYEPVYRFLYGGKPPKPYVFGWSQLPETGDIVYITGGEKDVLSLASHGFNAISFNSETARFPTKELGELSNRFNRIVIVYDTDDTGQKESRKRLEEYKSMCSLYRIELPLTGTKQEKDVSDYFRLGHTSEHFQELTRATILQKL